MIESLILYLLSFSVSAADSLLWTERPVLFGRGPLDSRGHTARGPLSATMATNHRLELLRVLGHFLENR